SYPSHCVSESACLATQLRQPTCMLLTTLKRTRYIIAVSVVSVVSALPLAAQAAAPPQSTLTVERIFSREFAPQFVGPSRWLDDSTYTVLREAAGGRGPGADLVKVDAASGNETVMIPAAKFVPPGASAPLEVEEYDWSADHRKLLIFTNSARVWRANTR